MNYAHNNTARHIANQNTRNTVRTVTVSTKYGSKSVQTSLTTSDAIKVLAGQRNASQFARDLVDKYAKYGLSVNQENWAVYLAQESLDRQNNPQTSALPALPNSAALFALFGKARLNLKYPRIRLETADGRLVVIKLSGSGSKHCGSLNLTNGVKYGDAGAVFYGYVHQDGTTTVKDQVVLSLLGDLASDPAGLTASQGLASGSCCFCSRSLSDSEAGSSEIGYGPICAGHYGLPWNPNGQAVKPQAVKPEKSKRARKATKAEKDLTESALAAVLESIASEELASLIA